MLASCEIDLNGDKQADLVQAVETGNPKPRTVRTPGAYVALYEPESSSFAYVWTGKNFVEVATGD